MFYNKKNEKMDLYVHIIKDKGLKWKKIDKGLK
jgi:hypothetical protein